MRFAALAWVSFFALAAGCASGGGGHGGVCTSSAMCRIGTCVDGMCVTGDGGGPHGDGGGGGTDLGGGGMDLGGGGTDLGPMCSSCDDGNACTTDVCDTSGACTHAAVACDDGNACTTDACDTVSGCNHTSVSCDDGNACTTDACDMATGCSHAALSCDDANACTTDACDTASGCNHTTLVCDDGDACTTDTCAPASGCSYSASGACTPVTVTFPLASTDSAYQLYGMGYYWNSGDYVTGSRTTTLAHASSATISLRLPYNGLAGDTCDFRMLINGVEVGRFSASAGMGVVGATFAFPTITGPTYTLRYEVTRTVISGAGAVQLDMTGLSTVMLSP